MPPVIDFSDELLQIEPSVLDELARLNSSEFEELCSFDFPLINV